MLSSIDDPSLVEPCVQRILASDCFARSPQARRFLRYVVKQCRGGDGEGLKAYTIGVSALGVNAERSCPETTARMQASRVRRLLNKYYQLEGKEDEIELSLPTGVYEPRFVRRAPRPPLRSQIPRLQLGPFESLTGDPIDDQLCRGLSEAIVGRLVGCDHLDVAPLRDTLGVESSTTYVLAGSVTRGGRSIRLSCHLLKIDGRVTVWSDRLDRILEDQDQLLLVQDQIASQLACRIGDRAIGVVARLARKDEIPSQLAGVDAFYHFLQFPIAARLVSARGHLEDALKSAPRNALLHAAYSCTLSLSFALAPVARKSELIAAEAHAKTAIGMESTCALAHLAKALTHYHHRESARALRELNRCVELDEVGVTVHAVCALLMILMGHSQMGLRLLDRCRSQAELPSYFLAGYSLHYFHEVGDPKRALSYAERIDLPNSFWADVLATASLSRMGRSVEARRFAGKVTSADPMFTKRPQRRLSELVYSSDLAESLSEALCDAGLGTPLCDRKKHSEYRVSLHRRSLPSEIRVGILHSLSGTMALSESHLVNAAALAIDEINQEGGVLGRPVRALIEDGASDPEIFARRANRLVKEEGVTSIFGCWTSSSRKAVLPVVERENALLWYPLQYEGLEKSKHIIYTGSCLNQQIEPAVRWTLKQERRSCYLIGSDYVFPRTANRLIRALVEAGGGRVMGEDYQPLGGAHFEEVVRDIARLKPEIVYNTVNGAENVELFRALARVGVHPSETPVMSFSLSELELAACGAHAEGQLACWSYFQSIDTPKNRQLVARFRRRYGPAEVLSDPAVTAYSQIRLWKSVAEKARGLQTEDILSHLTGATLELGDETFEMLENHHVQRRAIIGRVDRGEFRAIWSSPQAIAPQPWLGVDQTDFFSRDLILGALQALPELAERSSVLAAYRSPRLADATRG